MGIKIVQAEAFLRLCSIVAAVAVAITLGLDQETKVVFVERTARIKFIHALWYLVIVASVAAGYHFLQFCKCLIFTRFAGDRSRCSKLEAWVCFALDQVSVYVVLASAAAGAQASLIALAGVPELQWMKLCNIYTRFCFEIGGGLGFALAASGAMSFVSVISAHNLFNLYPSIYKRSKTSYLAMASSNSSRPLSY